MLRWTAYKAGLGLIRQNNFFYSESGSYVMLEAYLIDRELELIDHVELKPCPQNCGKCIEACPTHSLCAPYTMSLFTCVSFKNTMAAEIGMGMDVPNYKTAQKIGTNLYGCDVCQDVCPFNCGKWMGGEDFPGLDRLSDFMKPDKIMEMTYGELETTLAPKFWYISAKNLWKHKMNALTYMLNNFENKYTETVKLGLKDSNRKVRKFAKMVCSKLDI